MAIRRQGLRPGRSVRNGTIEPIQHLRAVAAIGVAFHHSIAQVYGDNGQSFGRLGAAGVDLFFVISGFIMWVTAVSRAETPAHFMAKRLIRIAPLYWLVTTFVVTVVLLKPHLMRSAQFDAWHVAASYAFIAWPHPKFTATFWPVVIPGWTLDYEMFFYAIVAVSLTATMRWRPLIIVAVLIGLALLGVTSPPATIAAFYTDPILLEFAFGISIGLLFTKKISIPRGWAYVLIPVALALFAVAGPLENDPNRFLCWGLPLALLVYASINAPTLLPRRTFRVLGDASYSIYLTQFCTIAPAAGMLNAILHSPVQKVLATLVLVVVAIGAGVVAYYLAERPVTDWVKKAADNNLVFSRGGQIRESRA
jgi:exopolysaccharide production protein ExoZ